MRDEKRDDHHLMMGEISSHHSSHQTLACEKRDTAVWLFSSWRVEERSEERGEESVHFTLTRYTLTEGPDRTDSEISLSQLLLPSLSLIASRNGRQHLRKLKYCVKKCPVAACLARQTFFLHLFLTGPSFLSVIRLATHIHAT